MPQLVVDRVSKQFGAGERTLSVLREVSLQLAAGENAAVLGPSGSGKSTLLQIIGTLDSPTSGTVTLLGEQPHTLAEPALAKFRNRRLGFVFQDHYLLPQLTALENVLMPALAEGKPSAEQIARAKELLDRVGLGERMDHRPAELSGGERQRAGVARALLLKPALILADEPTGNLDRRSAQAVGSLLVELQQHEQTMLLIATHSSELAQSLQRQLRIDDGQLVSA